MSYYVHPPCAPRPGIVSYNHHRHQHLEHETQEHKRQADTQDANILKFDDEDVVYDATKMDRVDIILLLIDWDPSIPQDLKDHMKKYRRHEGGGGSRNENTKGQNEMEIVKGKDSWPSLVVGNEKDAMASGLTNVLAKDRPPIVGLTNNKPRPVDSTKQAPHESQARLMTLNRFGLPSNSDAGPCKFDPACPGTSPFCNSICGCDLCDYSRQANADYFTSVTRPDRLNWWILSHHVFMANLGVRNTFLHARHYYKISDDLAAEIIKEFNKMSKEFEFTRWDFLSTGNTEDAVRRLKHWVNCGCVTLEEHRRKCQTMHGSHHPPGSHETTISEVQEKTNPRTTTNHPSSSSAQAAVTTSTSRPEKQTPNDSAVTNPQSSIPNQKVKLPPLLRAHRKKEGFTKADLDHENELALLHNERRKQGWVPPAPKPRGRVGSTRKASREEQPQQGQTLERRKVADNSRKTSCEDHPPPTDLASTSDGGQQKSKSPVKNSKSTSNNTGAAANIESSKNSTMEDTDFGSSQGDQDKVTPTNRNPAPSPNCQSEVAENCRTLISRPFSNNSTASLKQENVEEEDTRLSFLKMTRECLESADETHGVAIANKHGELEGNDEFFDVKMEEMVADEMLKQFTKDVV